MNKKTLKATSLLFKKNKSHLTFIQQHIVAITSSYSSRCYQQKRLLVSSNLKCILYIIISIYMGFHFPLIHVKLPVRFFPASSQETCPLWTISKFSKQKIFQYRKLGGSFLSHCNSFVPLLYEASRCHVCFHLLIYIRKRSVFFFFSHPHLCFMNAVHMLLLEVEPSPPL